MKKVSVTIPQRSWGTIKTKYPSDSIEVGLDDLTGSSKNFDSTVRGALTKRPGGVNYEQSVDADGPNKDQFEAIFTDGVHHLLKVVAGKLKFSSGGGTFATVTTGYSTLANFEFAVYQDRVYFDNGINDPQVYDRTTSYGGVAYSAPQTKAMGAQAPSSAATFAADSAGGSVPAGAHTYKVTFLYYDFEESNGGPASAVHTVVNPNNTVNLTAIPIGGYGVTARKIYRDNNDGNWLLVGTVANNTATTFADTASTGTAPIPLTNSVPPSFAYIVSHLDRTWIAGIPGDPSSLRFSEAGLPDVFPSAHDILCNPEDPITALVVYDRKVWVFNRNSIGRILGSTRDQFQYVPLPGSVGCVDNRSIRVRTIEGIPTLVWLSDKGFYGTNGSSVEYLSDPIEDLVNLNIQQAVQVKGQNAQTSQSQFQGGTASPGIDLTSLPGTITTPNPRRLWDDEADWEAGTVLTNLATNLNNQLRVPTQQVPSFVSGGTHANTIGNPNLHLATSDDFTGASNTFQSTFIHWGSTLNDGGLQAVAIPFKANRTGTLTSITTTWNSGAGSIQVGMKLYSNAGNLPGSLIATSPTTYTGGSLGGAPFAFSDTVVGGTYYWAILYVLNPSLFVCITDTRKGSHNANIFPDVFSDLGVARSVIGAPYSWGYFPDYAYMSFTTVSTPVATSGTWTGPIHDTYSDSAVAAAIAHTSSFPAFTSSVTTVQASNSPDMAGAVSQSFNSLNGSTAVTLTGYRYWRIRIQLSTTDDRNTPIITANTLVLTFSNTAVWVSEVLDHTTDITALNSLTFVTSIPGGTSATIEIATSADDITYTPFGPVGGATVQRYSKVRITLVGTNSTTPTVTSARLNWTLVSNLISSAINTGATPAGWDLFQAQSAVNGGTVQFYMRTASTLGGLTAASFVSVTNGQFPTNSVLQFAQWKVIITSMSDTVPTVDSVTINWFISQVSSIRVASLFYNRSYYLAAAEFNQTMNNLLIVLDGEGKWRIYRGISINTLGLFFNDPYYGSASVGRIIRFLSGTTDQGAAIEMLVETKAIDFGDLEHTKVCRKVYLKGKNTGAVYQLYASFDEGTTYYPMVDVLTGLASFTTSTDNKRFRRRFQLDFTNGNVTAGKTIKIKVLESTAATAEIDELKLEAWIRAGELVG